MTTIEQARNAANMIRLRLRLPPLSVATAGTLILISASMSANVHFGYDLGRTELAGYLIAAVFFGADLLKVASVAALRFYIAARSFLALPALAVFAVTACVSAVSGVGFFAQQTGQAGAQNDTISQNRERQEAEIRRIEAAIDAKGTPRAVAAIDRLLAGARSHPSWNSTQQCDPEEITVEVSRQFCREYRELEAERATAVSLAELQDDLREAEGELAAMPMPDGTQHQVGALAGLLGWETADVQHRLQLLILGLVELGAAFGLTLNTSRGTPRNDRETIRDTEERGDTAAETGTERAAPPEPEQIAAPEAPRAAPIPPPVVLRTELADTYVRLKKSAKSGIVTGSQRDIADGLGMNASTLNRHLAELSEAGLITKEANGKRTTIHIIGN